MKRSYFMLLVVLVSLYGSAPNARAVWTYGSAGPNGSGPGWYNTGWVRPTWGQSGFRPVMGSGYGMPGATGYPTYGYYYYGYPPAAYSQLQPIYPAPSPAAYGQMPPANAMPPGAAPIPAPWMYPYGTRTRPQFYYPTAPIRTVPRPSRATLGNKGELSDVEKRANRLSEELTRVTRERDQAQAELAMWTALGVSRDQITAFQKQLAKLQADNSSLVRRNSELEYKISWYIGPEREVPMPRGVSGNVLVVDPKYSFVVLNIGEKQGVSKNGKLLVNRNGKLVGKLRVTRVDSSSSIANILPDWKMADVMEGDQVIHQ